MTTSEDRAAADNGLEQVAVARFAVVPDLDMAGARGAALAALARVHAR